ncbi:glycerophosphodiester phosphodiesterase family protein [Microbacterium oryzae]|uniref:glycerophosphodiester phosphodiesterase family protein n=1 Tax=Microbacterium oryzae TaxID=743009 RepID=UPI0025AF7BC5|nr:glycerophosphodiester phosphodiesterase family protein [Microbacterium oryzae]MDN3311555.1 glycerophosphodiester phosphodiesterase family protein [Microbacterium oryzae]
MPRRHPLVIGHRGAPGYRPEHSRSSYALAFAMGVDAVEPDVVATRDGVLVVRHENEISGTTDVADHPEFADRRTEKAVDGQRMAGWFTEDFTWDELATLRTRERIPALRPASATFDDAEPILRLADLLDLVRAASLEHGREIGVVLEIKHATYFAGLGIDLAALVERDLRESGSPASGLPLIVESFEGTVLERVRERGVAATYIHLIEADGAPADLVARDGAAAPTYAEIASPSGLDALVGVVDGISVDKKMVLDPDGTGRARGSAPLVSDVRERGLQLYAWTCRPENAFLLPEFRGPGGRAAFGDYRAEWELLRELDGIFVDHPDLGMDVFRPVS